jgi:hypothetical protein
MLTSVCPVTVWNVRRLLVAIWVLWWVARARHYYAPPVGSGSVGRIFGIELNRIAPAVRGGTAWLADADSTVTTPAAMPSSVVPTDSLATRFRVTVLGVVRDFGGGHGATLPASNLAVDVSQSSLGTETAGSWRGVSWSARSKRPLVDGLLR